MNVSTGISDNCNTFPIRGKESRTTDETGTPKAIVFADWEGFNGFDLPPRGGDREYGNVAHQIATYQHADSDALFVAGRSMR
jgi:hypothetical protein